MANYRGPHDRQIYVFVKPAADDDSILSGSGFGNGFHVSGHSTLDTELLQVWTKEKGEKSFVMWRNFLLREGDLEKVHPALTDYEESRAGITEVLAYLDENLDHAPGDYTGDELDVEQLPDDDFDELDPKDIADLL